MRTSRSQPPCAAQGAARTAHGAAAAVARDLLRPRLGPDSGRLNRRRLRSRGAGGEGCRARRGRRGRRRWCVHRVDAPRKARPVDRVAPFRLHAAAHQDPPRRAPAGRRHGDRPVGYGVARRAGSTPHRSDRWDELAGRFPTSGRRSMPPTRRPESLLEARPLPLQPRVAPPVPRRRQTGSSSTGRRRRLPGRAVALRAPARAVAVWRRQTGSSSTGPRRRLRGRRRRRRRPPRRHPRRRLRRRRQPRPRPRRRRPRRRLRRRLRRLPGSPRRRPTRTRPLRAPRTAARIPSRTPIEGFRGAPRRFTPGRASAEQPLRRVPQREDASCSSLLLLRHFRGFAASAAR